MIVLLISCNRKGTINSDSLKKYKIEYNSDFFQWNGLVSDVFPIQLESVDDALIASSTQGIIDEENIYIFDLRLGKVVNFSATGKYKGLVGTRGNGPGEYVELRDFCVAGDYIYLLDYKKIHCFNRSTREFVESWSIDGNNAFNPSQLFVFDKNDYFLWCSNPDTWNKDKGEYYRLRKIKGRSIDKEYFKYEYRTSDDPRFYFNGAYCYIKPIDGEDIIYKLTKDSIFASFAIDFGEYAISSEKIDELRKSKERNAFLKSNYYKSISNVLETKDHIYFKCIGPDTRTYEGLINKKTEEIKFGLWDYNRSPRFFFTDGIFLYGYYEPYTLIENKFNESELNTCFDSAFNLKNINISDNIVIVKILLQ
ncbi:6-bladed beta-propeller [Bacteroides bouchesdurhonensis]|uniref:6-bladed beta-propeller n=1 Tax=Bacteroides bouchesdurhonensis TaxID=1841855 RepID=UPI0022E94A40|nr:6-bladed beta-propeller [Bacteroides bouchesdurhonensis]